MQAELEKWIEENTCVPLSREMIPVECVRALLSRFVLCTKEPAGYIHEKLLDTTDATVIMRQKNGGYSKALYAPADIGKPSSEPDYKALYNELLYQVATVVPGESRYETALRYIREREDRCNAPEVGESADMGKEGGE